MPSTETNQLAKLARRLCDGETLPLTHYLPPPPSPKRSPNRWDNEFRSEETVAEPQRPGVKYLRSVFCNFFCLGWEEEVGPWGGPKDDRTIFA